jgi:hypothetical protein
MPQQCEQAISTRFLISRAAMLQQAARERVAAWKRMEGEEQGSPHTQACRHSSTAQDLFKYSASKENILLRKDVTSALGLHYTTRYSTIYKRMFLE